MFLNANQILIRSLNIRIHSLELYGVIDREDYTRVFNSKSLI